MVRIGSVQTREPKVRCRVRVALSILRGVRIVAEVSEPEVRQQAVAQRVVETRSNAVVVDQRLACQTQVAESRSANFGSEHWANRRA